VSEQRSAFGRPRLLVGAVLAVVLAAAIVAVVDPFRGSAAAPQTSGFDSAAPTALRTVERHSLVSQTPVSGTLGYSGSWTVMAPAGTSAAVQQAEQAVAPARTALATARATASSDAQALADAQAALKAAQLKQASDCSGAEAAASSPGGSGSGGSGSDAAGGGGNGSGSSPCTAAMAAVSVAQTTVTTAAQKLAQDRAQLGSAHATLAGAQQALAGAEASATGYGAAASYTMLPTPGQVVRRGQALYAIDGQPTLLLYGSIPAWRAFRPGMSAGRDVAALNANLRELGYGAPSGDRFTSATGQAISALQATHGLARTGELAYGSVAFEPGAVRVTTVTPTVGQAVVPGPVLTVSSTRQDVSIQLDAAQQSEVKVGDRVTVTLPDNSITPGVVSFVGKVATTPSSTDQGAGGGGGGNGGSSSPTIEVDVRLLHAAAVGSLDQAPVEVNITTAGVADALSVPVNALLALAGGGYAVEVVRPDGTHQLLAVTPGLFDDAAGLVQVSGSGLAAGQRVVVPAT
jgi:hypothetical protein